MTKFLVAQSDTGRLDDSGPKAIGLIRGDVSGLHAPRHAVAVERHACSLGLMYLYTVRPPQDHGDPIGYALGLAAGLGVEIIVVYDLATVDHSPARVCEECDLETVVPGETWARARLGDPGSHGFPEHALTVAEAGRIMQQHCECRVGGCPRKSAAFNLLVRAGKVAPPITTRRSEAGSEGSTPARRRPGRRCGSC